MRIKVIFISVVLALLVLTIGGCGNKEGVQTDNNTLDPAVNTTSEIVLDPAQLLTKDDAEKLLGEAVGDPEIVENSMGQKVYNYAPAKEGTAVRFVQLSLVQTAAMPDKLIDSGYTAAKLYDDSIDLLDEAKEINDLGDRAFWGGSGLKMGAGLHVLQGDVYFIISAALGNETDDYDNCRQLAEEVLNRL